MKSAYDAVLPASITGGTAILSIIIGFISAVSPGVILLRAMITAVLTFLFILSVRWIVMKYLPELTEGEEKSSSGHVTAGDLDQSENKINILMPEESPLAGGNVHSSSPDGEIPKVDSLDNQIAENADFVHNNKSELSHSPAMVSSGGNDLDILPSLDTLDLNSGSESSSSEDFETGEIDTVNVSKPVANRGGEQDPAEIAKAVKTVLSRDQQK